MKLHISKKDHTLYLRLDDSKIIESEEVSPGVILDFNDRNEVVGIEMLQLSKRTKSFHRSLLEVEIMQGNVHCPQFPTGFNAEPLVHEKS